MAEPKPRQTSQPPLWRDAARLLALLPGIAAVGLAAIYGVGAVLWWRN